MKPWFLLPLSLIGAGCHSTWYGVRFAPAANEVIVRAERDHEREGRQGRARVLLSVRGVRRADPDTGEPARVEVRARLENIGQVPFYLQQQSLELLSGDLLPFGAARITSDGPPRAEPDRAAVLDLHFPMPDGKSPDDVHFDALHLRFSLDFDGEVVTTGVQFERRDDPYHDRSRFSFGFGYGYLHH
jgi:hypothetical protein